jgi:signal transduction histidine kinase
VDMSLAAEPLLSLAVTVTSEQRVKSVLRNIVQGLASQPGVALTRIWLLPSADLCGSGQEPSRSPEQTEYLRLVESAGTPVNSPREDWSFLQGHFSRLPLNVGKVGQVAASRNPILIKDLLPENDWILRSEWAKREGIRSFAGHPLIFRGNLLGVIGVFSRKPLTEQEFTWLGLFANQAAVAIANARAFEEVDRLRCQLEGERDYLQEQVAERKQAEEALRQAQADLAHANRVSSLGELTASLAHEVKQPIAATITNANTCLLWLSRGQPDLERARAAASRIAHDGKRAVEIVDRVRLLFQKGTLQRELVDLNETIREMMLLLRSEATKFAVLVRTELAADLPQVMGDRVQLQQVLMNLMMNSIDAMKDVDGTRELTLESQRGADGQVLISVSDTGVGLPPQQADKIFDAFFTTKTHPALALFRFHVGRLWHRSLSRRSQNGHVLWDRMRRLITRWLPLPTVCHPHPLRRMGVIT